MEDAKSLAEGILKEQERARELILCYKEIGVAGTFGALMIESVLKKTERAVMENNIVDMMICYEELKTLE